MNLLGARLQPETEYSGPPRQPDLGAKSEWTMDIPCVNTQGDLSADSEI